MRLYFIPCNDWKCLLNGISVCIYGWRPNFLQGILEPLNLKLHLFVSCSRGIDLPGNLEGWQLALFGGPCLASSCHFQWGALSLFCLRENLADGYGKSFLSHCLPLGEQLEQHVWAFYNRHLLLQLSLVLWAPRMPSISWHNPATPLAMA